MQLIQIARSWFKFIQSSAYTKVLMSNRLAICDGCDKKVMINPAGKVIMKVITNDPDGIYSCGACGCPLVAKTADPANECPLKKWGKAGEESYF